MTDVVLVELDDTALEAWLPHARTAATARYVAAGERQEDAGRLVDQRFERAFPGAVRADGHHVFEVVADGAPVGTMWLGPPEGGGGERVLLALEIDEPARGHGHGRAAVLAAEAWALADGGHELLAQVVAPTDAALALGASLGYHVVATRMYKDV